ncbi:MAG: ATPase [Dysgonamonadaceae bacterium]|jgi:N-acetylglucosamine kinase-like BadF-type ATPase|nr:ATPase [Dysgonamonadaceae bacterium]
MILLADSGSTKTVWALVDSNGTKFFRTGGINPYFSTSKEITDLLKNELTIDHSIDFVHFYGAGCTPEKASTVAVALMEYFKTDAVEVESDLLAAAHSLCKDGEGIACILGTGSNSCYYDRKNIVKNIPSLGYVLGDEGSGSHLGKKFLSGILKSLLPYPIIQDFKNTYQLNMEEIINSVYCKAFPNRFMAKFAPFMLKHINNPEIRELVESCFDEFISRNVLQYEKAYSVPVHFTGNIAFNFKENLQNVLKKYNLHQGKITKEPLPELIEYYRKKYLL